jgi:hypothetical protein
MIPSNIEREHILKAIEEIDSNGVPPRRESRDYYLIFKGRRYPPKYVVSLANKFANRRKLKSSRFTGGQETNNFLRRLGFEIVKASSGIRYKPKPFQNKTSERTKKRHDERCPECKNTVERMLREIYGTVESNYKFEVSTELEDYKDFPFYQKLKAILLELQKYRGHRNFVRTPILPRCDFFVPNPGFIVEFDESQHFTYPRKISLRNYPQKLKLGFSLAKWIALCEKINAKDNDPPFRDEQRTWYDSLRDFLPELKGLEPTVRLYSREMQWCSLNPENSEDVAKFGELIENRRKRSCSWVATVILQSNEKYSNDGRLKVLSQIVDLVVKETESDGVIVFPGGWFSADEGEARSLYEWVEKNVRNILSRNKRNIVVCIGIDGRVTQYAKDQIAIAISKKDIEAIGRKFCSAPDEEKYVDVAKSYLSTEDGKSRVFKLNGRKYFLCACYDCFGIRKRGISNFGIDVILDLVHGFGGDYGKGAPYFAKLGFSWTSKLWNCFVFGAAVFFHPIKPKNWPSGVYWNQGNKSIRKWKYEDNPIKPIKIKELPNIKEGIASIRIYNL